jgi:hypothetical protein
MGKMKKASSWMWRVEKARGLADVPVDLIRLNDRSSDKITSNQPNFSYAPLSLPKGS